MNEQRTRERMVNLHTGEEEKEKKKKKEEEEEERCPSHGWTKPTSMSMCLH